MKTMNSCFRKLKELVHSNSREESEALPHRMIAGDVNYECFEDTDDI